MGFSHLCVVSYLSEAPAIPERLGCRGTNPFDGYISKGWPQILKKDFPGYKNGQELEMFYVSKRQRRNSQLQVFKIS